MRTQVTTYRLRGELDYPASAEGPAGSIVRRAAWCEGRDTAIETPPPCPGRGEWDRLFLETRAVVTELTEEAVAP
jgi:hypothetical protein